MQHYRIRIPLLLILFVTSGLAVHSQHVPGTDWKQRETEFFTIIYPDSLSDQSAALAVVIDQVYRDASAGLPAPRPAKRWPLVLTDASTMANGYVTLGPKRSVWYATPGDAFTAVSDWMMLLAHHESRHMAQYDAADRGFTRFLHIVFGEYGWSAGISFGSPSWLIEGDAVVMETLLSEEGRGRDPLFTMENMALAVEYPNLGYYRAANPSFRRHIPNHYYLGYHMAVQIRQDYGIEALEEVYRSAFGIGLPVIGITVGMNKAAEKPPREIYEDTALCLAAWAAELRESRTWSQAEKINTQRESFARYDSLFVDSFPDNAGDGDDEDIVFARRRTLATPAALVRIDGTGDEKTLMRLPTYGRVSMARLGSSPDTARAKAHPRAAYRIVWDSLEEHPVFENAGTSHITVTELDSRGRLLRRYHPMEAGRIHSPALSPDGRMIAAVVVDRGSGSSIELWDADTGNRQGGIEFPHERAEMPSWAPDGNTLVFTLANEGGRRLAKWDVAAATPEFLSELSFETVKAPVWSADGGRIVYSSNRSGLEGLWSVPADRIGGDVEARLEAELWYGVYQPAFGTSESHLYAVQYVSAEDGEAPVRLPWDSDSPGSKIAVESEEQVSKLSMDGNINQLTIEENPNAAAHYGALRDPNQRESIINEGNTEHPESDYSSGANAFKVHSWGPWLDDDFTTLRLNIRTRDVLGTMESETGALYDLIERSPGAYTQFSFIGIRPVISILAEYRYRQPTTDPFHQVSLMGSLAFPINLARTGVWEHGLVLSMSGGGQWFGDPLVYPVLSYRSTWYRYRNGSYRSLAPEFGWSITGNYAHVPLPDNYGDSAGAKGTLWLPGLFRNASLELSGGLERRTTGFSPLVDQARGYTWDNPPLVLKGGVDYSFPLFYPDLPLGALVYIQRFRMSIFSDFSWVGHYDALSDPGYPLYPRWSTGFTLTMDFTAFNDFDDFSIGFRFNWLWQENRPSFDLMLMDVAVF